MLMKKSLTTVLTISILVVLSVFFYNYGRNVPIQKQISLYESLRNTSSIIFGVMGAWMAIIYPDTLSTIIRNKKDSTPEDRRKLQEMGKVLSPLIYSTIILIVVLLVGITEPLLKQIPILMSHSKIIRGLSYSLISLLTILQIWSILLTLLPADIVVRKLDSIQDMKNVQNRRMSRVQKMNEKDSQ
jgi:phosphotransferase system  glucose/maltose/N-acetylglucosamine-specific IIC component